MLGRKYSPRVRQFSAFIIYKAGQIVKNKIHCSLSKYELPPEQKRMANWKENPCIIWCGVLYYLRFYSIQARNGLSVSHRRVQRGCGCCKHLPRGRGLRPGAASLKKRGFVPFCVGLAVGIALRSESAPGLRRMRVVPRKHCLSSQIAGRKGFFCFVILYKEIAYERPTGTNPVQGACSS